jgi:hypothetical protein
MIGEVVVYGVYLPRLLWLMVCAWVLCAVLRMVLGRMGLYRVVWHRSLFNVALYVIVLGGTVVYSRGW